MVLHLSEDPGQGADQFRGGREVSVVSAGLARVLPEALREIETPVSTAAVGALPASGDWNGTTSIPRHPCGTRRCLESESPLSGDRSAPVAPESPGRCLR